MLLHADSGKNYSIGLLSDIHILAHAWEHVLVTTMQRYFRHADFEAHEPIPDEEASTAFAEANTIFSQVVPSIPLSWRDCKALDANVSTYRHESLEEMIAEVQAEDQSSSSDEYEDPVPSAVLDSAARDAAALLQHYFQHERHAEFLPSCPSFLKSN